MTENNTAVSEQSVPAAGAVVAEATVPHKKRRHINQQKLQDNLWGWAFCLPLIVGTVLFVYIALVMALLLSFTTYTSTLHGDVWAFLGNMFSGEDVFASVPGIDLAAAEALGLSCVWARSLPGRMVPRTAAEVIRDAVYYIMEERGDPV